MNDYEVLIRDENGNTVPDQSEEDQLTFLPPAYYSKGLTSPLMGFYRPAQLAGDARKLRQQCAQ